MLAFQTERAASPRHPTLQVRHAQFDEGLDIALLLSHQQDL
jgi:hypothetical protein